MENNKNSNSAALNASLTEIKIQAFEIAKQMFSENVTDYIHNANEIYNYLIKHDTTVSDVTSIISYPMGDGKNSEVKSNYPVEKH